MAWSQGLKGIITRLYRRPPVASPVPEIPSTYYSLFDEPSGTGLEIRGLWLGRAVSLKVDPSTSGAFWILQSACDADLWCRKRTSVTTMLDPSLFERYTTGDERIDDEWIVQTNPPSAFQKEFREGCDALLELLQKDPALHATHGWLLLRLPANRPMEDLQAAFAAMHRVVSTAERELIKN